MRHAAQRRRSAVRRAWLYCLLLTLPALAFFAAVYLYQHQIPLAPALCCLPAACCSTLLWLRASSD